MLLVADKNDADEMRTHHLEELINVLRNDIVGARVVGVQLANDKDQRVPHGALEDGKIVAVVFDVRILLHFDDGAETAGGDVDAKVGKVWWGEKEKVSFISSLFSQTPPTTTNC